MLLLVSQTVVEELASHPTVEYIKTLEEDVRRYQKALQDERKKSVEMRTALDSYRRQTSINYTQTPSHMYVRLMLLAFDNALEID